MRVFLSAFVLSICFAGAAQAGNCGNASQVAKDLFKKYERDVVAKYCKNKEADCLNDYDKYKKVAKEMLKVWNQLANNGWASIGPRKIEWGNWQGGKVLAQRTFVSVAPMNKNRVTIKVDGRGGKARSADVTVCAIDKRGRQTKLGAKGWSRKQVKKGANWSKSFTGVKGKIIAVYIKKPLGTNAFKYRLKANN